MARKYKIEKEFAVTCELLIAGIKTSTERVANTPENFLWKTEMTTDVLVAMSETELIESVFAA